MSIALKLKMGSGCAESVGQLDRLGIPDTDFLNKLSYLHKY